MIAGEFPFRHLQSSTPCVGPRFGGLSRDWLSPRRRIEHDINGFGVSVLAEYRHKACYLYTCFPLTFCILRLISARLSSYLRNGWFKRFKRQSL
jgi:hypothetical protein